MLYEDEDDLFMGSPKSKFFDILFHANKDLVKETLLNVIDRYAAMELLLEEQWGDGLEGQIRTTLMTHADAIVHKRNDFFITTVGEILTQNE